MKKKWGENKMGNDTVIMERVSHVSIDRDRDANADGYPEFLESIQKNFERPGKLFRTDAVGLFGAFLAGLPEEAPFIRRSTYNCWTCQKFVDDFGGLVRIGEGGELVAALWSPDMPEFFHFAVRDMVRIIHRANIIGVFLSDCAVMGRLSCGGFNHMAVKTYRKNSSLKNPMAPTYAFISDSFYSPDPAKCRKVEAEKAEDFLSLCRALEEYSLETVQTAGQVLTSGHLYRSEKAKDRIDWLLGLKLGMMQTKNKKLQNNMIWSAVAAAPAGWCHVKSSIVGSLLDDIKSGMSFVTIQNRWETKLDPTRYLRPQVAPDAGNIAQAEKLIEQMGCRRSFERRFARFDEIPEWIWMPRPMSMMDHGNEALKMGMFSHISPKNKKDIPLASPPNIPPTVMTWEKFAREILPGAKKIEYSSAARDHFSAIVTAENADAPPIIQWDREESRNPFSWYLYQNGSSPHQWFDPLCTVGGSTPFVAVHGICFQPSMWGHPPMKDMHMCESWANHQKKMAHQGRGVFFILAGCRDQKHSQVGGALFPEIMKKEFHPIRATVEAFSRSARLGGYDDATACGVRLQANGGGMAGTLKVDRLKYKIDRWD